MKLFALIAVAASALVAALAWLGALVDGADCDRRRRWPPT